MVKVCIIGAGISGLASIKSCLEVGLEPHCYETCKDVGGLWNREESNLRKDGARLYSSLISNSSREMTSYSDYPMPKNYPLFLTWKHVYDYLVMYADEFDLKRHINFQHKVLNVTEIEIDGTLKWRITIKSKQANADFTQEFDKLIICVGLNNSNYIPAFPGAKSFKGKIVHSATYSSEEDFTGCNVMVVGSANSGLDLAVGIGEKARNTYLSSRNGAYVINRLKQGYPMDMKNYTCFKAFVRNLLPQSLIDKAVRKIFNEGFDHKIYGIDSSVQATSPHANLVVNDRFPLSVACGKVIVVPEIEKLVDKKVYLKDGNVLEDIDVIFCATGYKTKFPFLSDNILSGDPYDFKLHKFIFPLTVSDPSTIAVVGCYPIAGGSRVLTVEMQSRYAACVLGGHTKLPTMWKMLAEHNQVHKYLTKDGYSCGFQLPPHKYSASMAVEIGVYPSFFPLLFTDPRLAIAAFFGPTVPYIYRLVGRGKCPEKVRDSILNVWNNCMGGLNKY